MLSNDDRYRPFGLVNDMLATPEIIRRFDVDQAADTARKIAEVGRLLMTGEGSSRIFPAKNAIAHAMHQGYGLQLHTEAGIQAREYDLNGWAVFALSNSGRTAEVIHLFTALQSRRQSPRYSLTAFADSKLESLADRGYVLSCGAEAAVAATKSVMEQALFYRALLEAVENRQQLGQAVGTN
jgi:glutamine---fructose-6-phosphate transaminase (isomerizing)